jgi:hypothetical protein
LVDAEKFSFGATTSSKTSVPAWFQATKRESFGFGGRRNASRVQSISSYFDVRRTTQANFSLFVFRLFLSKEESEGNISSSNRQ